MNTADFKYLKFPFAEFNPVQSEAAQYVDSNCNLVVAAPTSSGKTVVAEMMIARVLRKKRKAIFLSPLKAVTREKYEDWTSEKHGFSKCRISIVTGDYRLTNERVEELEQAHIILLTSEMLDSRTRRIETERNYWLYDVGICVCDEAHLLTMPGRGDNLESGVMRFTQQNPQARIILLSATMNNVDELARWLTVLNGKPTSVINSTWRPVELGIHLQESGFSRLYHEQMEDITDDALDIVTLKADEKFLIFCHSKAVGRKMVEKLEHAGIEPKFHFSDLELSDRIDVETSFKSRVNGTRVLVATSTLAWGINMPARNVIVLGTKRGLEDVHSIDIWQMVGRAGRYGIDERGDSYVLIPGGMAFIEKSRLMAPMVIRSQMDDDFVLSFHLISEIEQRNVTNEAQAVDWYERSFSAFQGRKIAADRVSRLFKELVDLGCIMKVGKSYICTNLGRVAAWMYFPPQDVAAWKRNFDRIANSNLWNNDIAVSWALGMHPSANLRYWPKDLPPVADQFLNVVRDKLRLPVLASPYHAPVYWILLGESFGERERKLGLPRKMQFGYERIGQALKMVNERCSKWGAKTFFEELEARISYGVPKELAQLCTIPNVGAKRAKRLFDEGITNKEDALNNPHMVVEALGKKVGMDVVKNLKKLARR